MQDNGNASSANTGKITMVVGVAKKREDPTKKKGELMESNMDAMEVSTFVQKHLSNFLLSDYISLIQSRLFIKMRSEEIVTSKRSFFFWHKVPYGSTTSDISCEVFCAHTGLFRFSILQKRKRRI